VTATGADTPSMSMNEATAALTAPGQLFEMEELDIRGVPTRTWKHAPPTLRAVIDMSLAHGDAPFLVYEDERTTFAEHFQIACTLAHRLQSTFDVVQGDRVAIIMRNLPEWIMAFWAATLAGAIVVPLNAWWSGEELRYGLEDSGSKVAFVDTERAGRIRPFLGGLSSLGAVIVADEHRTEPTRPLAVYEPGGGAAPVPEWPFPLALGAVDEAASPPGITIDPEDDATIFYTSGTTGRPKGAVGTHRNMCTNLMSLFFINTRGSLRFGSAALEPTGEKTQSAFLLSVPLFHATGCHSVMVSNLAAGGKIVMMHHFDPERALELIEREKISTFGGVPAMVMQVLDSPNFSKFDTSSVRAVSYGGAPAPPDLVRRIREAWPVGQPSNGYGLTETSSVTSMNSGGDYVAKPDSVGPPVPVCDVAIVPEDFAGDEPDDTLPRGPEVRGELWIKGPNVVRGYWKRPEETDKTFSKGWLHTGDVARLDEDNFIYIVDRAKDMIIRGGENVYSVQVEAALFEHPAVADCAVIGVPEPTLGEEVGAVVVLRPGAKVTADELALHVKARLAGFMVPTHIWFRSEALPRNPQGKVLKRELRQELVGPPT
jgi:long-chain acyl-CoA synthetase